MYLHDAIICSSQPTPLMASKLVQGDTNRLSMQESQVPALPNQPYKSLIAIILPKCENTMSSSQDHFKTKDIIKTTDKYKQIKLQTRSDLLPGLPNHLAELCLLNVQPCLLFNVCKSWRRFIYSPSFPQFFSLYALTSDSSPTEPSIGFFCLDPFSLKWKPLPHPAADQSVMFVRKHPSFISRTLPIQTVTTSHHLVLMAASTHNFFPALSHPLIFEPASGKWCPGPRFSAPRRWCAVGSINESIYMGSGTGYHYNSDLARSLERWDTSKKDKGWEWEKCSPFKDGKFSREAIEAVGYKGKLCMVNVNGKAVKEGIVYDVKMDRWEEMPPGMLMGWNGPTTVDSEGDVMYVVGQENGSLLTYDVENDRWEKLIEHCEYLKGAQHISVRNGKICAVSGDGMKIVVVDVFVRPFKIWSVDPPQEMEVISLHILPRMTCQE